MPHLLLPQIAADVPGDFYNPQPLVQNVMGEAVDPPTRVFLH